MPLLYYLGYYTTDQAKGRLLVRLLCIQRARDGMLHCVYFTLCVGGGTGIVLFMRSLMEDVQVEGGDRHDKCLLFYLKSNFEDIEWPHDESCHTAGGRP